MDKLVTGILILIAAATGVGVFIALLPVFLFVVGFFLMMGILWLIARIIS